MTLNFRTALSEFYSDSDQDVHEIMKETSMHRKTQSEQANQCSEGNRDVPTLPTHSLVMTLNPNNVSFRDTVHMTSKPGPRGVRLY